MNPRNAPGGCRLCDIEQRGHGRQYAEPDGWHEWQAPTQQQIKERMLARRAEGEINGDS